MKFELTLAQVKKIIQNAESEEWEDILTFEVKNGRLDVRQLNWSHQDSKRVFNKPI